MQFPGLVNGCTIDWFLSWPEEALTTVSSKFLDDFNIECTPTVKQQLKKMMAAVHVQVTAACQVRGLGWVWEGLGAGEHAWVRSMPAWLSPPPTTNPCLFMASAQSPLW